MYYLFGIALALAFTFALNFVFSLFASALWRVIAGLIEDKSARRRAAIIFALRVLPAATAFISIFVFFIPAYILFEPKASKEAVNFKLAFPALISLIGIGLATIRFFGGWLATRRIIKNWLSRAEPIEISGVSIPVFRINHPFPVIAVVGAIRPRMFIASQIFGLLDEAEMQAAIAHEYGHLTARDNLKSVILRFCRDLLVFAPRGKQLEMAWTENIESAADEYAARRGGSQTALDLAGALVKIARVIPRGAKPAMPAGAFLIERQTADVTRRVRRLLQLTENKITGVKDHWFNLEFSFWLYLTGFCGALILLAMNREFLHQIHFGCESVIAFLQ